MGAITAMLVSLGGIFLAKIGHGGTQLFPDSMQSVPLMTLLGWLIGLCGAMAAVIISRRSKGTFTLTRETVSFKGLSEKEHWEVPRGLITDCGLVNSWFYGLAGASMILLTIENPEGIKLSRKIGPFPKGKADAWLTDLKKKVGNYAEKKTRMTINYDQNGRVLESIGEAVSPGF